MIRIALVLSVLLAVFPGPDDAPLAAQAGTRPTAASSADSVRLRLVSQRRLRAGEGYASLGLTGVNKPNGLAYRLRRSVPGKTPDFVPRVENGLELFIADATADGWLGFYRTPLERWEGSGKSPKHPFVPRLKPFPHIRRLSLAWDGNARRDGRVGRIGTRSPRGRAGRVTRPPHLPKRRGPPASRNLEYDHGAVR